MKKDRYLTQYDAAILCKLAENLLRLAEVDFNAGEKLIEILVNSMILPAHARKEEYASLCSMVSYSGIGQDMTETIVLVCPQDANPVLARTSVISPIGLALIGHKIGSIVDVIAPYGPVQQVQITSVTSLMAADTAPVGHADAIPYQYLT